MNTDFVNALKELERERNISQDEIIAAVETAIEVAYKKTRGEHSHENVKVNIDRETGEVTAAVVMTIVDEVTDPVSEIAFDDVKEMLDEDDEVEVGDVIGFPIPKEEFDPQSFGRIAAQTAKQVIIQKIREAERSNSYSEFIDKQGRIVNARVDRISKDTVFLSVGSTEGILHPKEQVKGEVYRPGDTIKVYVMDVKRTTKGPQIFLSRSHPGLVRELFEEEIPEIKDGTVEIMGVAREAGSRTKMAVRSNDPNVDPVGACVGNRGVRVQSIVDELFGEKIDIIVWDEDPAVLIRNVLRPSTVEGVYINAEEKMAIAVVPEQQLSLAIGREGQNVRLAAKVSGWKIDIKSKEQLEESGFDFGEYDEEPMAGSADEINSVEDMFDDASEEKEYEEK